MTNPTPLALTLAELRELHALPDEALLNVQEAAAFLRLSPNALNWYRSQRRGPTYQPTWSRCSHCRAPTSPAPPAASSPRWRPSARARRADR